MLTLECMMASTRRKIPDDGNFYYFYNPTTGRYFPAIRNNINDDGQYGGPMSKRTDLILVGSATPIIDRSYENPYDPRESEIAKLQKNNGIPMINGGEHYRGQSGAVPQPIGAVPAPAVPVVDDNDAQALLDRLAAEERDTPELLAQIAEANRFVTGSPIAQPAQPQPAPVYNTPQPQPLPPQQDTAEQQPVAQSNVHAVLAGFRPQQ